MFSLANLSFLIEPDFIVSPKICFLFPFELLYISLSSFSLSIFFSAVSFSFFFCCATFFSNFDIFLRSYFCFCFCACSLSHCSCNFSLMILASFLFCPIFLHSIAFPIFSHGFRRIVFYLFFPLSSNFPSLLVNSFDPVGFLPALLFPVFVLCFQSLFVLSFGFFFVLINLCFLTHFIFLLLSISLLLSFLHLILSVLIF